MPDDNNNPNYELLLEKIANLEKENKSLLQRLDEADKRTTEVINFNKVLLNRPNESNNETKEDKVVTDKFSKYLEEK